MVSAAFKKGKVNLQILFVGGNTAVAAIKIPRSGMWLESEARGMC